MTSTCPACTREQSHGLLTQNVVPTCDNESGPGGVGSTSRGLTHLLDLGERGLAVKATQRCSIEGCAKRAKARGWCDMHYWRWSKHGDPLKLVQQPPALHCQAPSCERPTHCGRYCGMHRSRLTRYGSFDLPPRRERHTHSMGYEIIKRPEHPLATPKGWVYEHRVVLFDAIGPGWHPCHHCGTSVSWELTYPESPDALVVDHLDEDRANNDRSNLVPSCAPCNFARSNRWVKRRRKAGSA